MNKLFDVLRRAHKPDPENLSAYLDGALKAQARRETEAHLAACEACSTRLAELRGVREMLSAMPSTEAPRSFRLGQADVAEARSEPRPALLTRAVPAVAAMAVLVFGLTIAIQMQGSDDDASGSLAMNRAESRAPDAVDGPPTDLDSSEAATSAQMPEAGIAATPNGQTAGENAYDAERTVAADSGGTDGGDDRSADGGSELEPGASSPRSNEPGATATTQQLADAADTKVATETAVAGQITAERDALQEDDDGNGIGLAIVLMVTAAVAVAAAIAAVAIRRGRTS